MVHQASPPAPSLGAKGFCWRYGKTRSHRVPGRKSQNAAATCSSGPKARNSEEEEAYRTTRQLPPGTLFVSYLVGGLKVASPDPAQGS
ncbi:hypothetical protein BP5796_00232 [Coleophoma crateriformis]|uniref:Uncharacterized protein n=1 Tax=Coleophoma crateriformis TaxID=565419 RepID=A0A3D8T7E6_9HELO|nr:hypothetical protein BP5796_00232 [Coleophoma crateriformis]